MKHRVCGLQKTLKKSRKEVLVMARKMEDKSDAKQVNMFLL